MKKHFSLKSQPKWTDSIPLRSYIRSLRGRKGLFITQERTERKGRKEGHPIDQYSENLQVKLSPDGTKPAPPLFPAETTCQNIQFKDFVVPFDCTGKDVCRSKSPLVPCSLQRDHTEDSCNCDDSGRMPITNPMVISSRKPPLQRNRTRVVTVARTSSRTQN